MPVAIGISHCKVMASFKQQKGFMLDIKTPEELLNPLFSFLQQLYHKR